MQRLDDTGIPISYVQISQNVRLRIQAGEEMIKFFCPKIRLSASFNQMGDMAFTEY